MDSKKEMRFEEFAEASAGREKLLPGGVCPSRPTSTARALPLPNE